MTIIIFLYIVFILLYAGFITGMRAYGDGWATCVFGGALISFIGTVGSGMVTLLLGLSVISKTTTFYTYDIVSLSSKGGISGSYSNAFFVGVGYLNSTENYVVMRKVAGGYQRELFNSSGVVITEQDGVPPHVVVSQTCSPKTWANDFFMRTGKCIPHVPVKMIVPVGTIVQEFKI